MASQGLKLFLVLAQSPTGAPTVSPFATPTPAPVSLPTATPSPSPSTAVPTPLSVAAPTPSPTAADETPASAPGASAPVSPTVGPSGDNTPADSNSGFMSKAAIGGATFAAALVAVALM